LALLVVSLPAFANSPEACQALRHRGKQADARECFSRLATSADPYLRAEGLWGLGRYQDASGQFKIAVEQHPQNADYRVRWGRLFLERWNKQDSAQLFQEALEIRKDHAGALLGIALVAADGFERKAVEYAEKAIAADPKLVEAYELLARLAIEDADRQKAAAHAKKALEISPEALDAMALLAAIDWIEDRPSSSWEQAFLKVNPAYGEGYKLAGDLLVINRRYEEGIKLYRKAVEVDPQLWSAHSQLGINLMRLGEDTEARRHLELCYDNGYRDPATVNTLRLLDSYRNFEFYRAGNTILKLHKKEAAGLRVPIESELKRAIAAYEKKYGLKLERPVQVEVYPDHEDFAVRTLGMPGLGALGVAFGYVVAMDSPSGRPKGTFHWASTLWHELSHVYVLAATKHRVPRWFTEGLAVHEETAASPDWGDPLSPEVIAAIRDKKLLPIASLDRGFIRATYPAQVQVSYFQAGRICDYIARTWGEGKLVEMIRGFGARKTTPEVVREVLGIEPEEFDKRFIAWIEGETSAVVKTFPEWRTKMKSLLELAKANRYDDILKEAPAVRDLFPGYVEHFSAYQLLAEAHLAKGNKQAAAAELEAYSKAGGRDPELIKKLAGLLEEAGRKKEASAALARLIYIDPLDEEVHRRLGDLCLEQGNVAGAIREYSAVIGLQPGDPADAHYKLARAYRAAAQMENAKEHLVLALEAAPGFRPAQKMLLEISQ
jgi:tetratricopeptide (TPR) repeat protein